MVLVSVGCTDYDEQIRDLHNKIDQNQTDITEKVDAEINALEADLAQVKADLEAALEAMKNELSTKHKEDVDALKAVDAELDGKIAAANDAIKALEGELAKEVSRLEGEIDTLEAALEAAKKELADAIKAGDDAVKAELTKKITDLETDLLAKINDLQTKLEGDIENLRKDMQDKIDAANDAIDEANDKIDALELRADATEADVDALQADIADIEKEIADNKAALEQAIKDGDAAVKAELEAKIAALESELKGKIAALEAQDKLFAEQLKELEENLNTLSDRVTANYNELKGDLAALETKLQAQIDANKRAIEENALDIVALQAQAEGIIKDVETVRNNVANVEKALVAHIEEFAAYQAAIAGKIAYIESHISALEEQVAAIEALLPEMQAQIDANKELAQQNAADIAKNEALFEAYKQAVANTFDQLTKADAALAATLAALADDVAELDGELAALVSDFETYKANVDSQLSDCFAGLDNLEADLDAVNKSLSSQIAANKVQTEALQAQVTAIWAVLTQYQNKLNEEIANREAADANILKLLNDKYNELDAEYDARCNKLAEDLETLDGAFKEYKESMVKVIEQLTLTLRKEIAESEVRANKYTDIEVGKLKDYTDKKLDEVNLEIKGLKEEILNLQKGLMTAYNQLNTTMYELYVQCLNVINARVAELQTQIDELVNRIQSIVPVPEYYAHDNDMRALMHPGTDLDEVADDVMLSSGAIFDITYRITPAEAASQIVEYCKKDKSILHFALEEWTRAENPDGAKIFDVKLEENATGRIVVTGFIPKSEHLTKIFNGDGDKYMAVALVFNNEKTADQEHKGNIVSDFTTLFPAVEYLDGDAIVLQYNDNEVIGNDDYTSDQDYYNVQDKDEESAYFGYDRNQIKYDDLEKKVTVFEGWEPRLVYNNEFLTVEEYAKEVFGLEKNNQFLPEFVVECDHTYYNNVPTVIDEDDSNFVCTEDKEGYNDQFAVAQPLKSSVGNVAETTLNVSFTDMFSASFFEEVEIVKTTFNVELADVEYTWNYADYKTDMGLLKSYTGANRQFTSKEEFSNMTADIYAELTSDPVTEPNLVTLWDPAKSNITVTDGEGNAVAGTFTFAPVSCNEDREWQFTFSGWEFGKEYVVEVKNTSFDEYDVVFKFTIKFIDIVDEVKVTGLTHEFSYDATVDKGYTYEFGEFITLLWQNNEEALKPHFATAAEFAEAVGIQGIADKKYLTVQKNGEPETPAAQAFDFTNTPAATYTYLWSTNENANRPLVTRISANHVTSENDVWNFTHYFTPTFENSAIKLYAEAEVSVVMPKYVVVHEPVWVKEISKTEYKTNVMGNWSPDNKFESAVYAFSTSAVVLTDAFVIKMYNKDGQLVSVPDTDPNLAYLAMTFDIDEDSVELDETFTMTEDDKLNNPKQLNGIKLDDTNTILSYDGKAASIGVNGTLTINGLQPIVIEKAFEVYNGYYRVYKYDPIKAWEYNAKEIDTQTLEAKYVYNLIESLSLKDLRGRELINPLKNGVNTTSPWVVGNDENGFRQGYVAGPIFGIKGDYGLTFGDHEVYVAGTTYENKVVKDKISVQKDKGTITFTNMNQMAIYEELVVKVPVMVDYPWGRKEGVIEITILENDPAKN